MRLNFSLAWMWRVAWSGRVESGRGEARWRLLRVEEAVVIAWVRVPWWGEQGGWLRCRWGRPDLWVVLRVYVCLFESIVPRDFTDLRVDKLRLVKS